MYGNGAATGMVIIRLVRLRIRSGRRLARTVCSVAARGATSPGFAVRRPAATPLRLTAPTATASVLPWPQFNERISFDSQKAFIADEAEPMPAVGRRVERGRRGAP